MGLDLNLEINYDLIDDYLTNIKEYNENEQVKIYKTKLKEEMDYNKKLELAKKALEIKKRREIKDEWDKNVWRKKKRFSK